MARVIGWDTAEVIEVSLVNFNFSGRTPDEVRRDVVAGHMRWALLGGGVLTTVSLDYELQFGDHFLREITPWRFETGSGYIYVAHFVTST